MMAKTLEKLPKEQADELLKELDKGDTKATIQTFAGAAISAGLCAAMYLGKNWARITLAARLLIGSGVAILALIGLRALAAMHDIGDVNTIIILVGAIVLVNVLCALRLLMSLTIKAYTSG